MNPHLATALASIQVLRSAATRGDPEAVEALAQIGIRAAGHLAALSSHPDGYPGRIAADTVAAKSERWPVVMDSIREMRYPNLPDTLGSKLAIRIDSKRARNFDYRTRTGFTLSIMREMDIRGLPPLSVESLSEWTGSAMQHLNDDCQGDFEAFPWPENIRSDAEARSSTEGVSMESAYAYVLGQWLKYGFGQLAKGD